MAQRVTQNATDNASLAPLLNEVRQRCGALPTAALADSGFFSIANLEHMEEHNVEGYVPDSNLACALNLGTPLPHPGLRRRASPHAGAACARPAGQANYARRKAVVEPVFGVLKQQRGMRQFRTRGLDKVSSEFTLAALAFNLTRLHTMRAA